MAFSSIIVFELTGLTFENTTGAVGHGSQFNGTSAFILQAGTINVGPTNTLFIGTICHGHRTRKHEHGKHGQ
jgi:hypothetical protein